MGLITYIILLALSGLIIGAFGRLALPGKDPMTIPQTIGIGIAGSFIAGIIAYALFGGESGGGILLSIVVTAGLVYLVRRARGGSLTDPGTAPRR